MDIKVELHMNEEEADALLQALNMVERSIQRSHDCAMLDNTKVYWLRLLRAVDNVDTKVQAALNEHKGR